MDISIVIVSWNTETVLLECLRSIYSYPPPGEFEIWLVDNASTDNSVEQTRMLFPLVNIIENHTNVGFARANNQAIEKSSGRFVVLLNPDTLIHPYMFDRLIDFINSHATVGSVGPRYLNLDGSLQRSCAPFPSISGEFWRMFHLDKIYSYGTYNMREWDQHKPREVDVLQGACLLIRRLALDKVGLLDNSFFMYSEETDLCYRLNKAGWKLYWIPEAVLTHLGGQSTRQAISAMFLRLYESKIQFIRKHYGRFMARVYKIIILATAFSRILTYPVIWCLFPQKRQSHWITVRNYWMLLGTLYRM
jgi:N-acetylglucosaminyl-diphospho-decaprenol L-rhamnosyltransferase